MKYCTNCLVKVFNNSDIKDFKAIGSKDYNRIIIFPELVKRKRSYSKGYMILKDLFDYCLDDIGRYWCTSVCKCDVPSGLTKETDQIINNCRNNLCYDYNIVKPKIVLLLGRAVNSVINQPINSARNMVYVINNVYYFSTYNPTLISDPKYSETIKYDIERFCKSIMNNNLSLYEVVYG